MKKIDKDGRTIIERDGYLPDIINDTASDEISFQVDNATGKIIGWIPLTEDCINDMRDDMRDDEDLAEDLEYDVEDYS